MASRLVYSNRIAENGHHPKTPGAEGGAADSERAARIGEAVRQALSCLTEDERELIAKYHFQGWSYRRIAEESGRVRHKLEALHQRALRRLRVLLEPAVQEEFGITAIAETRCQICRSRQRSAIEAVIAARDRSRTWRPVMRLLRERFGLTVRSPQLLIGHERFHMPAAATPEKEVEG